MWIPFVKMAGAGNDFIVMDNRRPVYKGSWPNLAKKVCDRHRSVGADGLLLLERSKKVDFKMRYFNSDGSEASMCGNGGRCMAKFAEIKKMTGKRAVFETKAGLYQALIKKNLVELSLPPVESFRLNMRVRLGNKTITAHFIDSGVPHAVIFVPEVGRINVQGLGRILRFHKAFGLKGTNVDFVKTTGKSGIRIRTYERGVEDETLACGTGAVASACIASLVKGLKPAIRVRTQSGRDLIVDFRRLGDIFEEVKLTGEARVICEGKILI